MPNISIPLEYDYLSRLNLSSLEIGDEFWAISYHRSKGLASKTHFSFEPTLFKVADLIISDSDKTNVVEVIMQYEDVQGGISQLTLKESDTNKYFWFTDKVLATKIYLLLLQEHMNVLYEKTDIINSKANEVAVKKMFLEQQLKEIQTDKENKKTKSNNKTNK